MSEPSASEPSASDSGHANSWGAFLKSIASFNGDLASLTAPPFILSPVSLTEYSQNWLADDSIFLAPSAEKDEVKRFLAVVRWFIATLRGQYCSRNEKLGSEKKPLNPFLGELFVGKWDTKKHEEDQAAGYQPPDTEIILVSEQVSHHPPITAYRLWDEKTGTSVEGFNGIKARISTSTISVKQQGHAIYKTKDESYLLTLPALHIEGILFGSPYVELEGSTIIRALSGWHALIEFSGKGYFSGKKNTFKAKIYSPDNEKKYEIKGQWSKLSTLTDVVSSVEYPFLDATNIEKPPLYVKPIEEQDPMESRRAWKKVADACVSGDFDLIHREKSKIENEQRQMRKDEEAKGIKWEQRWFEPVAADESDDTYKKLCESAKLEPEGHWRFVPEKFDYKF